MRPKAGGPARMSDILHIRGPGRDAGRPRPSPPRKVFFDRAELNQILSVYSRNVIAGEWCDYAIEGNDDEVAFAIFGRAGRFASYRVVKRRRGSDRGRYRIVGRDGRILETGAVLARVLGILQGRPLRLI